MTSSSVLFRTYLVHLFLFLVIIPLALVDCKTEKQKIRVAVFNIKELSTEILADVDENGAGKNPQALAAAKIIQRIRPDVLVISEIDHDYESLDQKGVGLDENAHRFSHAYLNQGDVAIDYRYTFAAPCNTGILSGLDLNRDGIIAGEKDLGTSVHAADCFGWGTYPGQYSMALLSMYPIDLEGIRTFQKFLWKDLPGNHIPVDYFSDEAREILRLSSKSHCDVPVKFDGSTVHLLLSHPTPPVFDGDEDRNGRRNFDEIKFWVHYLENDSLLYDDAGIYGGFNSDEEFIIAGDLNASMSSGSQYDDQFAIMQLLNHPKIKDTGHFTISKGAYEGRAAGPPNYYERSTVLFGNDLRMRIDYLLPSSGLKVTNGGVFWPSEDENKPGHDLAEEASDHRLVWIDIEL